MNANEWIEEFTGLKLANGAAAGPDPLLATAQMEQEAAKKQLLLAEAHKKLAGLKSEFQKAMQSELRIKGALFKQKMLDIKGTQIDEAEFEDMSIDYSMIDLEPATKDIISKGSNLIMGCGGDLKQATIERDGKQVLLFTNIELEDGYWFPLTRERVLPETYIGAMFSKTQRMLNETNALYNQAVEVKREKGELTPKANRLRDLVQTGAELASVGADLAAGFGAGSDNAELAGELLGLIGSVVEAGGDAYDKIKAKEYADASGVVLDACSLITVMALKKAGVDDAIIEATKASFKAGGAAINAGKKFAEGASGAAAGTEILANVLKNSLDIAASLVTDPGQKAALKQAAAIAPMAMKAVGISADMVMKVNEGDTDGVIDCLTRGVKAGMEGAQDLKKLEATRGMTDEQGAKIEKGIDEDTKTFNRRVDLATLGAKTVVSAAIMAKKGAYLKAFDTLITNVGEGLTKALIEARVDEKQAKQIGIIYKSAASAPLALEALMDSPPDVKGALSKLASGIESAFAAAAPDNAALQEAGRGLATGFASLDAGIDLIGLYNKGEYEKGVKLFVTTVDKQVKGIFEMTDIAQGVELPDDDEEEDDEEEDDDEGKEPVPPDVKQGLLDLIKDLGEKALAAKEEISGKIDDALEAEVKKVGDAEAQAEAQAILDEAKADMWALAEGGPELSDAEKFSREAADIDKLIAKMRRDQLIMTIAQKAVEGGTAFLASFIPALGAVSAGLKMMASMVAAAQRAQQLYQWTQSRNDFATAQSELTSASQNFVRNQADQFAHHSIQAAFHAAEMIGNVLETVGAATFGAAEAAGLGLKVAAKAGAKLEEIIQRHKKVEELEYAWRVTKASLKNPTNRKLGLRARALSPTMAKYAIAWGAVNKNDPLARNALRACDLTEAVLENENANVDKVVEYLEVFYNEDQTLYREVETAAPWVPTDIVLTLRFWNKLKSLAVENIKLENTDTGNLDGLLVQLKGDLNKFTAEQVAQRIELLNDINRYLGIYQPVAKKPDDVKVFLKVVALLRKQVEVALAAVEAQGAKLAKSAAELKAAKDARAAFLDKTDNVLGELNTMLAMLNSFNSDDEVQDLYDGQADAEALIKEINAVEALRANVPVQSHVKQLQAQLVVLENLIGIVEVAQAV
jgi:hypothetical protein